MPEYYEIESRRYIGNKTKLKDWIMATIQSVAVGATSFCDMFAGTGTVAHRALPLFDSIVINDLLYSNRVIYGAFFEFGEYDMAKLQAIVLQLNGIACLNDNWFSESYGGLYFDMNVARKAGAVRQAIENMRTKLTVKEYHILLASLIYSIDRLANTVGHFEAYIKKPIGQHEFVLKLVRAQSYDHVAIYREDANALARHVSPDVVYIDPPYNSRQYSRFYHVYETLVKWDKPILYGVARKPAPENMSDYCRVGAYAAFSDLIGSLKAKYIAVSYNNTYHSRSKSSQNRISLDQIEEVLAKRGDTTVYTHKYNAFNAGKTDLNDHKEYLFLTKIQD